MIYELHGHARLSRIKSSQALVPGRCLLRWPQSNIWRQPRLLKACQSSMIRMTLLPVSAPLAWSSWSWTMTSSVSRLSPKCSHSATMKVCLSHIYDRGGACLKVGVCLSLCPPNYSKHVPYNVVSDTAPRMHLMKVYHSHSRDCLHRVRRYVPGASGYHDSHVHPWCMLADNEGSVKIFR